MAAYEELDYTYNLWGLLSRTRNAMWKARQFEVGQYDLSVIQCATMWAIDELAGKATSSNVARWLVREPHSISELISRMEKTGLVKKVRDPIKKHRVRISLTDKGHEIYHNKSSKSEMIHKIMSCLSHEELEQFSSTLQKLLESTVKELALERLKDLPS